MPPKKLRAPFKAPRQATKKGTTSPGVGHRKDNAEWGKRMERELGQIEKRQKSIDPKQDSDDDEDNVPFSTLKSITDTQEEVSEAQGRPGHLGMLSEREADETARFGEVLRCSSDSEGDEVPITQTLIRASKEPTQDVLVEHKDIGMKIARDFGVKGVFLGQVVAVEYDSEDVDKIEDIYVVEYTDGDREDMSREELEYANEFFVQVSGLEDDTPEGSLHTESGEEECYVPSPPVCLFTTPPLSIIPFLFTLSLLFIIPF
jgi:hypothetical protein